MGDPNPEIRLIKVKKICLTVKYYFDSLFLNLFLICFFALIQISICLQLYTHGQSQRGMKEFPFYSFIPFSTAYFVLFVFTPFFVFVFVYINLLLLI